jgi:general secretion pathway protein G
MKPTQIPRTVRAGFTLVELLVVVAIIAVLVGLTAAAVMKLTGLGPQVATRTEIGQLETAIADFNREFKISGAYFPSRLKLCEKYGYYDLTKQLDQDSVAFLTQMFPAILRPDLGNPDPNLKGKVIWVEVGIDWNGNGVRGDPPNQGGTVILEGDQCLVFFLGGIPVPKSAGGPGVLGFNSNQHDPAQTTGSRKGPFFEFNTGRLTNLTLPRPNDPFPAAGKWFYSYGDGYKFSLTLPDGSKAFVPYAYFSSYKSRNGYNPYYNNPNVPNYEKTISDCSRLGVWPYAESLNPTRYLKPNSFQIICAGADGTFGPGTDPANPYIWTSTTADQINPNGRDDQANFASSFLNVPE